MPALAGCGRENFDDTGDGATAMAAGTIAFVTSTTALPSTFGADLAGAPVDRPGERDPDADDLRVVHPGFRLERVEELHGEVDRVRGGVVDVDVAVPYVAGELLRLLEVGVHG